MISQYLQSIRSDAESSRFEAARTSFTKPTSVLRCLAIASLLSICFSACARRYDSNRAYRISLSSWFTERRAKIPVQLFLSYPLSFLPGCPPPWAAWRHIRRDRNRGRVDTATRFSFASDFRLGVTCHDNVRIRWYIERITQCPSCESVKGFI